MLRAKLREAMSARQSHAVSVLRETLAAIDNAEAPPAAEAPKAQAGVIAGGVAGLGAGEVARLALSPRQVADVVEGEIRHLREASAQYAGLGRPEEAAKLSAQAGLLEALLGG